MGMFFFTVHGSISLSFMKDYLAIESGGSMNSFRSLIAALLDASQRSRHGVQLNMSASKQSALSNP